jgi:hypothetical protein
VVENAPGCPAPRYEYDPPPTPLYSRIDVLWDTGCVDPGEEVVLAFGSDCPGCEADVNGHSWLFGTPTPTPTPSPTPTAPPTPSTTPSPTATLSPAPTSTKAVTPTPAPSPTVTPGALPRTGGTNEAGGGPSELLAALAGLGGLLVSATCICAQLRQPRRSPRE